MVNLIFPGEILLLILCLFFEGKVEKGLNTQHDAGKRVPILSTTSKIQREIIFPPENFLMALRILEIHVLNMISRQNNKKRKFYDQ